MSNQNWQVDEDIKKLIYGHIQEINEKSKDILLKSQPNLPNEISEADRIVVMKEMAKLESTVNTLLPFVKNIKNSYIKEITEQTLICAIYILLCHVIETWEATFLLSRSGLHTQAMNLERHIGEILDLIEFLMIKGDGAEDLKHWFYGGFISPAKVRKVIASFLEKPLNLNMDINFYNMHTYIYSLMSTYTHSGYCAMLESIDVFDKDFDFEKRSCFHRIKSSIGNTNEIMNSTIIAMKSIFLYLKDDKNYQLISEVLKKRLLPNDSKTIRNLEKKFPKN